MYPQFTFQGMVFNVTRVLSAWWFVLANLSLNQGLEIRRRHGFRCLLCVSARLFLARIPTQLHWIPFTWLGEILALEWCLQSSFAYWRCRGSMTKLNFYLLWITVLHAFWVFLYAEMWKWRASACCFSATWTRAGSGGESFLILNVQIFWFLEYQWYSFSNLHSDS